MDYPLLTGAAGRTIGATEPQLNDLIRRKKLDPEPPIRSGRRLWYREHLLQAAAVLGLSTDQLRARVEQEGADVR